MTARLLDQEWDECDFCHHHTYVFDFGEEQYCLACLNKVTIIINKPYVDYSGEDNYE